MPLAKRKRPTICDDETQDESSIQLQSSYRDQIKKDCFLINTEEAKNKSAGRVAGEIILMIIRAIERNNF